MSRSPTPRPLRVAYLGHTAALSGGELAFVHLLASFRRLDLGVDARVLLAEDGPLRARLEAAGATTEVVPMAATTRQFKGRDVRGILPAGPAVAAMAHAVALARRLAALEVDIVHTMSLKAALYGGVAGRLARRPVVWSIQDRVAPDFIPAPAVRVVRAAARVLPRMIIANSRATASTLAGAGPPAVVIHPVVPPVAPAPRRGEPIFTVALIGRLAPWKGQDVFLRSVACAFPDGDVRARIIGAPLFGEEPYAEQLRALARDLGIADRVELRGHRDDIAGELAEVDVVVHCSTLPEPFGMVVVEAMSAGRPVIASAAGGPCEIVEHGVSGLLTAPRDVAALAAALRRLADDPGLRDRLAEGGRQRAATFTGPASALATRRCYREVAR